MAAASNATATGRCPGFTGSASAEGTAGTRRETGHRPGTGQPVTAGQRANPGVIFDVDGTLLDTNYLHVTAWWEAFRERGHDIRCADVHRALGMGSAELVQRVLGRSDPSVIEAHGRHFAPYLRRMRPLPGAADLLTATARLGLNVVLATSAKDDEIDLMLDAIGARDVIGTVISSGAVERTKPHPDIVALALSESGTDRVRAVMVGDAVWDVIAARRAGIPCIGLLSGGIADEQLRDAGAIDVYPDPAALLGNLQTSMIGKLGSGQQAMLGPRTAG
jgi:HAD superfamily hydrolase (TIGR01509 family)